MKQKGRKAERQKGRVTLTVPAQVADRDSYFGEVDTRRGTRLFGPFPRAGGKAECPIIISAEVQWGAVRFGVAVWPILRTASESPALQADAHGVRL